MRPEPRQWLAEILDTPFELQPLPGDASFRRYIRVHLPGGSRILMDAPPDKEPVGPFLAIHDRLASFSIDVPAIAARDATHGYLLMEDLGGSHLEDLDFAREPQPFLAAAAMPAAWLPLPHDDLTDFATLLEYEGTLFSDWLLTRLLELPASEVAQAETLIQALNAQVATTPTGFVHRDHHSRNLMVTGGRLVSLDFQDAVAGPRLYDIASLLYDSYAAYPDAVREKLWRHFCQAAGLNADDPCLRLELRLVAAQRNLKASGIFARLWLRDGKPRYLASIPNTLNHLQTHLDWLATQPGLPPPFTQGPALIAAVIARSEAVLPHIGQGA
ncbi:MAG: hypothetical protein COX57_08755 [Alphaproteobacteria bacterium CG_4_10_14_0_2_um_filter_63_37]|nr:MAG: hypothetical protein AUJ55_06330 [Proteobacteria bacterium CG1_02_64_396]PJA24380.1 MAG: hypothetical protein COX57_08755 [Alphaproteobacteria bacterium CG_4_10_14_0_2_um_filter_63_37]